MAGLASLWEGFKSKCLCGYLIPGAPVGRLTKIEHMEGMRAETMCCPDSLEESAVTTTIHEDNSLGKLATMLGATNMGSKV